jgi:site-specific DNA-cytosine methylase
MTGSIPSVLEKFIYEVDGEIYLIRIRKLTPRECWRLMGFSDDDFDKAASVNSNTQLYKQAGNSIVKQVLMQVFSQMLPSDNRIKAFKKRSLSLLDLL